MKNRRKLLRLLSALLAALLLLLLCQGCAPKTAGSTVGEGETAFVPAQQTPEPAANTEDEPAPAVPAESQPSTETPPEEVQPEEPTAGETTPAETPSQPEEPSTPEEPIEPEPEPDPDAWKLILVNGDHPIPEGYTFTLKELRNGHHVDERIYPELQQMFDDARAEGIYPFINESYRTAEEQQRIMDSYIRRYEESGMTHEEAEAQPRLVVAVPGTSEHQIGLALDIKAEFDSDSWPTWEWLLVHCWEYGFILRYPADKTEITGYSYEPWHFRYVGVEAAKEIMEQGLCLEEYVAALAAARD